MPGSHRFSLSSFLFLLAVLPLSAQAQEGEKAEERPVPDPVRFESEHAGTFNGESLRYRAVVADIQLKRDNGKAYASVFTTSYLREGVEDLDARPVTFVFNGGPGSASVWLRRRAKVPSARSAIARRV